MSPSFITSVSTHSTTRLGGGTEAYHPEAQGCEAHESEAQGCDAQGCEAHELETQQASLEEGGGGYGPRREFFLLAGQAMIQKAAGEPVAVYTQ